VSEEPRVPDDVTGNELDAEVRAELRTLPKELATRVARHLVMTGRLIDEEPDVAYRHARVARRLASRVGIVREAAGLAAYHAGEWADALAELRAARRLRNTEEAYLPILADCERGLGRPERALDLAKSPAARRLAQADRVELRIVESGARRDLGQYDAAVVTLQIPELHDRKLRPWSARLFYAYADALLDAGREKEAVEWFARSAAADRDGVTDAPERYAELEGLEILDLEDEAAEGPSISVEEALAESVLGAAAKPDETAEKPSASAEEISAPSASRSATGETAAEPAGAEDGAPMEATEEAASKPGEPAEDASEEVSGAPTDEETPPEARPGADEDTVESPGPAGSDLGAASAEESSAEPFDSKPSAADSEPVAGPTRETGEKSPSDDGSGAREDAAGPQSGDAPQTG